MEYKSNEKRSNTARLMHNEFTFTFSVNTLGDSYEQTCTKRHKNLSLAPQESRSNLLVYTKGLPCFLSEANTQYRHRSLHRAWGHCNCVYIGFHYVRTSDLSE